MRTTRPAKPSWRRVSAALAPARLAPTITMVWISLILQGSLSGRDTGQGEELLPGAGVVTEQTVKRRGDGFRPHGPDTSHRHALVFCFEHHSHAFGGEVLLQPVGHLLGQALLDLEVAGEELDHPGQLRQPEE